MEKRRSGMLRYLAFYLHICLFSVIFCCMSAMAADSGKEQKTVRVGYVNVVNYEEGGEGEYKRGAGYEYLQKISYLIGWNYEYVYGSFKECLEDAGAVVTIVTDGQQALELFREKPAGTFDAILMDIMMPVMDGYAATKAIRALNRPDAETIPIIAMTANAFQEDEMKCLAAGMNAHLAKPLDMEKVKRTICSQIRKRNK